jgi:hypothetical protein
MVFCASAAVDFHKRSLSPARLKFGFPLADPPSAMMQEILRLTRVDLAVANSGAKQLSSSGST